MKIETNKKLATVLIANYNNSKYIDECLSSVINQSYKKIEIIVVDDNSSDNSLEILNKYTSQIKLIKKKQKIGLGSFDQMSSYYEAFKESKGEIIFLLDSDDYFHLDKVSIIMNEFHQNKKKKILFDLPIKKYTNKEIDIQPVDGKDVDKSFVDTRKLINYKIPTFDEMILEMVDYIYRNRLLYSQYQIFNHV